MDINKALLFFVNEQKYELLLLKKIGKEDSVKLIYDKYVNITKAASISIPNLDEMLMETIRYVKNDSDIPEYYLSHIISQINMIIYLCNYYKAKKLYNNMDNYNNTNYIMLILRFILYYIVNHVNSSIDKNVICLDKCLRLIKKLEYFYKYSSPNTLLKKTIVKKYIIKVKLLISDLDLELNKRIDKNYLSSIQRKIIFFEKKI